MSRAVSFTVRSLLGLLMFATFARAEPMAAPEAAAVDAPEAGTLVIKASDAEALQASLGKTIAVEGEVASAAWSRSGKVLEIRFVGGEGEKAFTVVAFDRNRKAFEAAFGGDLSRTLGGATIRVSGKVREYGGKAKALAGRLELTLDRPGQLTIVKAAPTTRPVETRPEPKPAPEE